AERLATQERDAKAQALAAEQKARDQAFTALRAMTDEVVEQQMARATTLTEENKDFLRRIIEQFDVFAAITGEDAESRTIRAAGRLRVGLMRYRLGDLKEAETALAGALTFYKQLVTDFPSRADLLQNLASSHSGLGNLWRATGRPKQAEEAFTEAVTQFKQL